MKLKYLLIIPALALSFLTQTKAVFVVIEDKYYDDDQKISRSIDVHFGNEEPNNNGDTSVKNFEVNKFNNAQYNELYTLIDKSILIEGEKYNKIDGIYFHKVQPHNVDNIELILKNITAKFKTVKAFHFDISDEIIQSVLDETVDNLRKKYMTT